MALRISGIGCSLIDNLYTNVSFSSENFRKYCSKKNGDGGLTPGKLAFRDNLSQFAGKDYAKILHDIVGENPPDIVNIGGPAIVAMIHASQLLNGEDVEIEFHGRYGNDEFGRTIMSFLNKTQVNTYYYKEIHGTTPSTDVFSDPVYNRGHGDRTFVNSIGVASDFKPEEISPVFYRADLVFFGGTALLPRIHKGLTEILSKAKENNAVTVVGTAFDFINEQKSPDKRWPIGRGDESYPYIDLIITDHLEALRLSGMKTKEKAAQFFQNKGAGACYITHGVEPIFFYSNGNLFKSCELTRRPISETLVNDLKIKTPNGDTTGCGDNFAGGILASLAKQIFTYKKGELDMMEALAWGVASGGFACFYPGGMYSESVPGEKREKIEYYVNKYKQQISFYK